MSSYIYNNEKILLYKKNGNKCYPDFNLYKMIARNVNNHTSENQLYRYCFMLFISTSKFDNFTLDIDNILIFLPHQFPKNDFYK